MTVHGKAKAMVVDIKSKKGLLKHYEQRSHDVQGYFQHLPNLVQGFPLDVALAYVFATLERGQNMALYCGVVKLYRAHTELASKAFTEYALTRKDFVEKYKVIFGVLPPASAQQEISKAEATRDAVMHGKVPSDSALRNAIADVLLYADAINSDLEKRGGFCPFCPDLRGFKGRAASLDKSTTRWLLKGMGFALS